MKNIKIYLKSFRIFQLLFFCIMNSEYLVVFSMERKATQSKDWLFQVIHQRLQLAKQTTLSMFTRLVMNGK